MSNSKNHKIYPFFKNGRFFNFKGEKKFPFFLPTIFMLLKKYFFGKKRGAVNFDSQFDLPKKYLNKLAITWIGHSTFLIQIAGINILTDPVFGSLFPFSRVVSPGISLKDLPPIDYVVISHNHRDHMDASAIKAVHKKNKNAKFLVGEGSKSWFLKNNISNVYENMWWEKRNFVVNAGNNIEFTFLPAFHWSQRGLFDYNKSLWGSWMISIDRKNLYFAGDTAYNKHFKCIAKEFNSIDVAFLPVAPCSPRYWMKHSHLDSEEAGKAFLDLKAEHLIPMHWGTYNFGLDDYDLPMQLLNDWWQRQNFCSNEKLNILKIGKRNYLDIQSKVKAELSKLQKEL